MINNTNLASPLTEFMGYFLHIHQLNHIQKFTLNKYEKQVDATVLALKVLKKLDPEKDHQEEQSVNEQRGEAILAVRKEINDNYYSIKTSEIILMYSRLESAITEVVYKYFENHKFDKLPTIENTKINLLDILKLPKKEQKLYLADLFIQQKTLGVKYGFRRFEAIVEPLFGRSELEQEHQDNLFKCAQTRNLLIHKNGIIDKQYQSLIKLPSKTIGKRLDISDELMNEIMLSLVNYAANLIDRIKASKCLTTS